ncbi:MAG: hypothetical protein EU532_06220 [Promethearchaeota archaeon]|nr:MAG: hypothetical protein EU532_06220 [Candidatus Lokiarchaeota archaeon]
MNLYHFFKRAFTTTFIIEVICGFFLLVYILFLLILGYLNIAIAEIEILLLLISLGVSCLITLIGVGFFMRLRNKFIGFLGSEEEFPSKTTAQKVVLVIWILAILFFGAAVFYGLFLVFQWYIYPSFGQAIPLILIFIILGVIIICLILQGFLIIMAKYTRTVVTEVLDED